MCLQWKCERVTDSTDLYNGTERVTFSIKTDLERIGPLHDPLRWYKITHAGLGRKLDSGTSKTKQLVPVRLDLPLFWKSHYATCVSARVILYQTLSLVESYSLWGYRWRDLQLDVKQLWKNLRKCRYFPINRNHVSEMSTGTLPTSSPASGKKMRPSVMGPFSYGPSQARGISQFRVAFAPCSRTSPHAKIFVWKWVWFAWKWTYRRNAFSKQIVTTALEYRENSSKKNINHGKMVPICLNG